MTATLAVALPPRWRTVSDLIGMDWNEYLDALAASELAWRDESYVAGMKALRLCTDVATYRALLKGQAVPGSRMDQVWARRYGLL